MMSELGIWAGDPSLASTVDSVVCGLEEDMTEEFCV